MSGRVAGRSRAWLHALRRASGVDRAIAYTVLARGIGILGSAGTVLLIVRLMSPVEQGYYYVLLSLISLRVFFELGATLVITQMAAHECVHLVLRPDGSIDGSPAARTRLASLFQQTIRWFACTAACMVGVLLPVGWLFLASRPHAAAAIHWRAPWAVAVMVTAALLVVDACVAFLEGCGLIRQAAAMRIWQTVASALLAWSCFGLHAGLFAPASVNLGFSVVAGSFLWRRRALLLTLMRIRGGAGGIRWRHEVWPFQWRIAVSTLCAYGTTQIFTPIIFAARGPVEAGQVGMSLSIASYLGTIVISWMSTKAPVFGGLVAGRDFRSLDALFFRTLRQSLALLALLSVGCEVIALLFGRLEPRIATRMVTAPVLAVLLVAALGSYVVQSEGMYLRAFKREPFLAQSLAVSAISIASCLALVGHWGTAGVAVSYLLGTGVVGLASATAIFHGWRKRGMQNWQRQATG